MNTEVHGFPAVLAKKKSTHCVQYKEKLRVYTNTHPNISIALYHQTTKSNKQQLLYVLFDASKLHIIYNM